MSFGFMLTFLKINKNWIYSTSLKFWRYSFCICYASYLFFYVFDLKPCDIFCFPMCFVSFLSGARRLLLLNLLYLLLIISTFFSFSALNLEFYNVLFLTFNSDLLFFKLLLSFYLALLFTYLFSLAINFQRSF